MSKARYDRSIKKMRGQYLTPPVLAERLVSDMRFLPSDRVYEPGFGNGSFLLPLIRRFMGFYTGSREKRLRLALERNVWGVEQDPALREEALTKIEQKIAPLPAVHHLTYGDFFETGSEMNGGFTHVIGNPPFGGVINRRRQDQLELTLGKRHGMKIRKETYAWFIVRSMDLLAVSGRLRFICSDTLKTIITMRGLRHALMKEGETSVQKLEHFSEETRYPMLVLDWRKTAAAAYVQVNDTAVPVSDIERTPNLSWGVTPELAEYFTAPALNRFVTATSGMTIGNNRLFLRKADNGTLLEPYDFCFTEQPVTLDEETRLARLGRLTDRQKAKIVALEKQGATRRVLQTTLRPSPMKVHLPSPDYSPYNRARRNLVYAPPVYYVYWRNQGEAVLTYKRCGPWYLRGVGGAKWFGKEGITWRLVSNTLDVRWLPPGYVLDSGSPCAFPRKGVTRECMMFIMGWTLTGLCNRILKQVVNHTLNIQSKDLERLPFPAWVSSSRWSTAVRLVDRMLKEGREGRVFTRNDPEFAELEYLYTRR